MSTFAAITTKPNSGKIYASWFNELQAAGATLETTLGTATTVPTASTIAKWDANVNLSANAFIPGFTTTATAAGTTVMTIASTEIQNWTGSTTQNVNLPTTSIVAGATYVFNNFSSGVVTIRSSGANTIVAMAANTSVRVTALVSSPTTAANWTYVYSPLAQGITGTGNTVLSVSPTITGTLAAATITASDLTINNSSPFITINSTNNANGTSQGIKYVNSGGSYSSYNWFIGTNINANGLFEFVPSTTSNGTTYSGTSALTIKGSDNSIRMNGVLTAAAINSAILTSTQATNQIVTLGITPDYAASAVISDWVTTGGSLGLSRANSTAVTSNSIFTYNTAANAKINLAITSRSDIVFVSGVANTNNGYEVARISGNSGISGGLLAVTGAVTISTTLGITGTTTAAAINSSGIIKTTNNGSGGFAIIPATTTTWASYQITSTGGNAYFGMESSAGGDIVTGSTAYATVIAPGASRVLQLGYSGGTGVALTVDTSGNITMPKNLAVTGASTFTGNVGIGIAPANYLTIHHANNAVGSVNYQRLSTDGLSNGDQQWIQGYATGAAVETGRFGFSFSGGINSFVVGNLYNSGAVSSTLLTVSPTLTTSSIPVSITDSTDSTTSTTGSLKTAGGLGVAKALNVGTTIGAAGNITANFGANSMNNIYVNNSTSGVASGSKFRAESTHSIEVAVYSSSFTTSTYQVQDGASVMATTPGGIAVGTTAGGGVLSLWTGGTSRATIDANGNLTLLAGMCFQGYDTSTATSGTITASANKPGLAINSAGGTTLIIKLPSSPIDGQRYFVGSVGAFTTVTWQDSGGTAGNVIGGQAALGGTNRGQTFMYSSALTKWLATA